MQVLVGTLSSDRISRAAGASVWAIDFCPSEVRRPIRPVEVSSPLHLFLSLAIAFSRSTLVAVTVTVAPYPSNETCASEHLSCENNAEQSFVGSTSDSSRMPQ